MSAYSAIRGREQDLYDSFRRLGLPLANIIKPIWDYNPAKPTYMAASHLLFGKL